VFENITQYSTILKYWDTSKTRRITYSKVTHYGYESLPAVSTA